MGEASPRAFVLYTKPASSLDLYAHVVLDDLNKYAQLSRQTTSRGDETMGAEYILVTRSQDDTGSGKRR